MIDTPLLVHGNGKDHVKYIIGAAGDDGIASHLDRCGELYGLAPSPAGVGVATESPAIKGLAAFAAAPHCVEAGIQDNQGWFLGAACGRLQHGNWLSPGCLALS